MPPKKEECMGHCDDHSNMMEQLKQLNVHFVTLLDPNTGILIQHKLELDRLKNFKSVILGVLGAIAIPVLGIIGVTLWEMIKKGA